MTVCKIDNHRRKFVTVGGEHRCEDCARREAGWVGCANCLEMMPRDAKQCPGCLAKYVTCPECDGTGEMVCECCGIGTVVCEGCEGTKTMMADEVASTY